MSSEPSLTIVLVDDDPGHVRLSERNLRRAHITNDIVTLRDGQQAVDYLFKARTPGLRMPCRCSCCSI